MESEKNTPNKLLSYLPKIKCSFRTLKSKYRQIRLSIDDYIWPTNLNLLYHLYVIGITLILGEPEITFKYTNWVWNFGDSYLGLQNVNRLLKAIILSGLSSFVLFVIWFQVRQLILRNILSYRGWLYRENSKRMIVWGLLLKLFSGNNPKLFNIQRVLPRLPIPSLNQTLQTLLESYSALLNPEELENFAKELEKFSKIAWKLQIIIKIRSWFVSNYISEWWEKYVYLRARSPISITTNYHGVADSYTTPSNSQKSRGATITYLAVKAKAMIDSGEFQPLMIFKTIPFCSHFYNSVYSTTRVPGKEYDSIARFSPSESRHVIVICKGLIYKLTVYDSTNEPLEPQQIEKQIEWIQKDCEERYQSNISEAEKSLPALTTLERTTWAEIQEKFILSNERNSKSLKTIESGIMCLVLSDLIPKSLSEKASFLSLANGKEIWYDKSMTVCVSKDARSAGGNSEHSVADGSPVTHVWEWIRTKELSEKWYNEDNGQGTCLPPPLKFGYKATISPPEPLMWDISEEFESEILKSVELSNKQNSDIHFEVVDHANWGKGFMKKHKLSPDAFVQIALQYAFYLDMGELPNTYEATMTRLFYKGRTETVRSMSIEAVEFIRGMVDTTKSKKEKASLLRKAVDKHQMLFKDSMSGKGIDRHLFALYITGKGLNYDMSFLEGILSKPWTLSTSQTPIQQIENPPDFDSDYYKQKMAPGGGFITVCDEGYGCAYVFTENRMFFQISSKHSCPKTCSKRYGEVLFKAMDEIKFLLD